MVVIIFSQKPLIKPMLTYPATLEVFNLARAIAIKTKIMSCRDFSAILGRGPKAFQIAKISVVNTWIEKFSKQTTKLLLHHTRFIYKYVAIITEYVIAIHNLNWSCSL